MRKHIKSRILELLDTAAQLHGVVISDINNSEEYLSLCVSAVTSIGESLAEKNEDVLVYISEMTDVINGKVAFDIEKMDQLICHIGDCVLETQETYRVVFFPYNASMWDCMESVYLACVEDENCEAIVVPIPYYKMNKTINEWEYVYEKSLFEIPTVSYKDYSLEKDVPDVAYIHNPYDDMNLVTRVAPEYFSSEIKKHVGALVYIPYYVTNGDYELQEHEKSLPAYEYADYIVFQSEYYKEKFQSEPYYDKILALGSPKLDRIINMCKEERVMPLEWKMIIGDRKAVMLNTTIASVLSFDAQVFKKLISVFEHCVNENIAIIWRPHPLLESTIEAMRPHLKSVYRQMIGLFQNKKIGILDTTPDISKTVAMCEGYMGCPGSSVTNLFRIAKKPVYVFDYLEDITLVDNDKILCTQVEEQEDKWIMSTNRYAGYFEVEKDFGNANFLSLSKENLGQQSAYPFFALSQEARFFSPLLAKKVIRMSDGEITSVLQEDSDMKYGFCIKYEDKIYYLPWLCDSIMEYNIEEGLCIQYPLEEQYTVGMTKEFHAPVVSEYVLVEDVIFMCSPLTNRILKFNLITKEQSVIHIEGIGYNSILVEDDKLWVSEIVTGDIIEYSETKKKTKRNKAPQNLKRNVKQIGSRSVTYLKGRFGDFLVSVPILSDSMVKWNLKTGESTLLLEEYFDVLYDANSFFGVVSFAKKIAATHLLIQCRATRKFLRVNVENETYEEFDIYIDTNDFEYINQTIRKELSEKYLINECEMFSLPMYLKGIEENMFDAIKDEDIEKFTADIYGLCGKNIHNYIKEEVLCAKI